MKGDFIQLSNGVWCRKKNIQSISRVVDGEFTNAYGTYAAKVIVYNQMPESFETLYFKSVEEARAEVDRMVRELTGWDVPKTRAYNSLGMAPCKFCGMAGDEELALEKALSPHGTEAFIYCCTCSTGHQGPWALNKEAAVRMWNERQGIYA